MQSEIRFDGREPEHQPWCGTRYREYVPLHLIIIRGYSSYNRLFRCLSSENPKMKSSILGILFFVVSFAFARQFFIDNYEINAEDLEYSDPLTGEGTRCENQQMYGIWYTASNCKRGISFQTKPGRTYFPPRLQPLQLPSIQRSINH